MITNKVAKILKRGGIGVLPTDTLYGLVGSALSKKAVARIYKLKQRAPKRPLIVLIGSMKDLAKFGVKPDKRTRKILGQLWPGPISVILPCPHKQFAYLHRGTKTLAFRLSKPRWLRNLLSKTGPLVAPSANLEGERPAETIAQAKNYFGNRVDFYVSAGKRMHSLPSTLIAIEKNKIQVLRKGANPFTAYNRIIS